MTLSAAAPIGNESSGSEKGTLTCFAVLRSNPSTKVLLSNEHVLLDGSTKPRRIGSPDAGSCRSCCVKNVVAVANPPGKKQDVPGPGGPTYVDCAIAQLQAGVTGVNRVAGLTGTDRSTGQSRGDLLGGSHAAQLHEHVTVTTYRGFVTGTIAAIDAQPLRAPGVRSSNQIQIQVDSGQAQDVVFGSGDSGAAVVNQFNEVVGVMYARGSSDPDSLQTSDIIFACPIGAVLDALQIDIPPEVPSAPHAGPALLPVPEAPAGSEPAVDRERLGALERRLRATLVGDELVDLGYRHGTEIGELVHRDRRVTLAWHRCNGPAWVAHLLNAARDDGYRFPAEVGGVTRRATLERMRDALTAHGSDRLRADLERYGTTVIEAVDAGDLAEVLDRLEAVS